MNHSSSYPRLPHKATGLMVPQYGSSHNLSLTPQRTATLPQDSLGGRLPPPLRPFQDGPNLQCHAANQPLEVVAVQWVTGWVAALTTCTPVLLRQRAAHTRQPHSTTTHHDRMCTHGIDPLSLCLSSASPASPHSPAGSPPSFLLLASNNPCNAATCIHTPSKSRPVVCAPLLLCGPRGRAAIGLGPARRQCSSRCPHGRQCSRCR